MAESQRNPSPKTRRSPVRLGVIADVHGDHASLRDALGHLARLGCTEVICAGDLVDWGPSPDKSVALLSERQIPCVRGNHDRVAGETCGLDGRVVSDRTLDFIERLPRHWRKVTQGVRVVMLHARPDDDMRALHHDDPDADEALEFADADVLVVGHTHEPMRLETARGVILNPGSILRNSPKEDPIPVTGTFGVLEFPSLKFTVHRTSDGSEVELRGAPSRRTTAPARPRRM